jgi:hypothetical protein
MAKSSQDDIILDSVKSENSANSSKYSKKGEN